MISFMVVQFRVRIQRFANSRIYHYPERNTERSDLRLKRFDKEALAVMDIVLADEFDFGF